MDRREITKKLSELTEDLINPHHDTRIYWAREVTFDYSTDHPVRVDYMKFKPLNNTVSGIEKGDFYCYEVKSSVEDFKSKNGHNFIGDFNYYIMTEDVYDSVRAMLPYDVGVYCPDDSFGELRSVKKAFRRDRSRPVSEMLLMMFRSAARDRKKDVRDGCRIIRCKDCALDGLSTCPICYIEDKSLVFVNHDPNFYCGDAVPKE